MGGYYPTPGRGSGAGRSYAPGPAHEFTKLLKDHFLRPGPYDKPDPDQDIRQYLREQPFKPKEERPRKPTVPLIPWKPPPKPIRPPGPVFNPLKHHPAWRAFDFALQVFPGLLVPRQNPGVIFGPGWYHVCGDMATAPDLGYGDKWGLAPGHTVLCGTSFQVPDGYLPLDTTVSDNGPAQFMMGPGHLFADPPAWRYILWEVWRLDAGMPNSPIKPRPPRAPIAPPVPLPQYQLPPEYLPPGIQMPPAPYPPRPTARFPHLGPTENSESGPKQERPRPPASWPKPPGPPPPAYTPPKAGVRERKFRFVDDWLYQFATWLMGLITEASDFVEVLWESLPAHIQARYRNAGFDAKLRIIYDNYKLIDGEKLVEGLIADFIEDAALGKFGDAVSQAVKKAAKDGLYVSPKGLQFKLGDLPAIEWTPPT